jgi:hypothetical protein
MKVRGTPSTSAAVSTFVVAALLLAALVAVIGSAQAAPQTKVFASEVRLTDATTSANTFTLMLTNISKNNVVGSANFTAPTGFTVAAASQAVLSSGNRPWTVTSDGTTGLVKFRADSSSDTLKPGQSVQASVSNVTIPSGCTIAAWTVDAKQSNDFSSAAGNAIQPDLGKSDLVPLGSFAVSPEILTVKGGQSIPAIETDEPFTWTATAKDTCGQTKSNYSGVTASLVPTGLTDATPKPLDELNWTSGVGTVTFTPTVTETGNRLKVADSVTKVNASSTSGTDASNTTIEFFDVTDTICVPGQSEPCEWKGGKNDGITAHSDSPPAGANLGIGFNGSSAPFENFLCDGGSAGLLGDAVVNINPRGYGLNRFTVEITYAKSISGNKPASQFTICTSKTGLINSWTTAPECTNPVTVTPCLSTKKRTTGGDLLVILTFSQNDPWGGAR